MRPYFGVHNHTHYSNLRLLDSINRPEELIKTAEKLGLSGIAITDHECLSAHMEVNQFAKDFLKEHPDFTIALGNEIYLTDTRDCGQKYYHFILLAKDEIGYKALKELSSTAWINSYTDRKMERVPTLKSELKNVMAQYKGHVIATTACIGGELGSNLYPMYEAEVVGDMQTKSIYYNNVVKFIEFCINVFGKDDFYLECAPSTMKDQLVVNQKIYQVAKAYDLKMVIGTDAHYLTKKDRPIHKAYLNSKDGEREVDSFYEFAYVMDSDEVEELMLPYMDTWDKNKTPQEIMNWIFDNTLEIQKKIKFYSLERKQQIPRVEVIDYKKGFIPADWFEKYPVICSLINSDDIQERYWVNECIKALQEKQLYENETYISRLETEANVIKNIGEKLEDCLFAYFNTFKHYIDLFWECGSIVGPGRGSATGFLSNYLLGITQLDPIRWGLPYWRLTLNKIIKGRLFQ